MILIYILAFVGALVVIAAIVVVAYAVMGPMSIQCPSCGIAMESIYQECPNCEVRER